ncbi:glycosyltransferase family 39 protein [Catellatospora tritici]|uniref:glycosyltransferase family 39 protein n=1 Tax=Catellatospora tritici TaxID=2851566 RepID=UPI001C2D80CC|nr:glycosyltransferase family 39 protein [Catellatospora tritici]MBV1854335.1 glycosyltransferase family 39 protein [Catellatospora tritici]
MTTVALPERPFAAGWSLSRAAFEGSRRWLLRHAVSLALLSPLLAMIAVVHRASSRTYPTYVDDSGVYLADAWAALYQGALSPYTYTYDHPPGGWLQIALWAALTDGFNRYDSALDLGAEVMLIAKVAASALVYAFGRRLGFSRLGAMFATVLFGLCPLGILYGRWMFLDNIMIVWLLAAFVLAYAPSRTIGAATGATLAFAMATLTKETALIMLPAFGWALAQNLDRRNRQQVLTVSIFCGVLLLAMFPLLALYKGELFARPGRTSLLGTAWWQLAGRPSLGWVLDVGSGAHALLARWLADDPYLLIAGLVAVPLTVLVPRLRPATLALLLGWLVLPRGGYVPFMYVVVLLPFSALLFTGAIVALSGNRKLVDAGILRVRTKWVTRAVRGSNAFLLGVLLLALTAQVWINPLRDITREHDEQPLRQAVGWLAVHVPRDKVLVVHDAIWTDLVHRHGFSPQPIMVYKLDTDPQVLRSLRRIDYLVVPDWYYTRGDQAAYPTLLRAREHAVEEASFGTGEDAVHIYRVSAYWRP